MAKKWSVHGGDLKSRAVRKDGDGPHCKCVQCFEACLGQ